MIYKTLKKVSDVCQVLDKSKYNPSQTINGVTFTKNDDGTFTANGTATAMIDYRGVSNNAKINVVVGHKYLMRGCPAGGSKDTYDMRLPFLGLDYGNGVIAKLTDSGGAYYVQIIVRAGIVCDNLIFKPQLFDLTEMFGAGNEPTTVEQFRQDFPEELYDYKPYCFVKSYKTLLKASDNNIITSYKKSLICTTKNLFDNIPVKINYIINSNGEEVATSGYNIYGKMYGNNFTISTNAPVDLNVPDNWLRVCLYNSEGTFITRKDFDFNTKTVTNIADDNIAYIQLCFHRKSFPNYKLQVELGSTATEYVPYGYL